jgi:polygalacturonase
MDRKFSIIFIGAILFMSIAGRRVGTTETLPSRVAATSTEKITAALPVIPDAKFNLADYGGVGDGKAFNTEAFKNAVAAIAKAGGGRLIVPSGVYKTLPFTLTSHMDLHMEAGATIKAPDTFAEYGIPDPNIPATNQQAAGACQLVAPLISCPPNTTDLAITGSGV